MNIFNKISVALCSIALAVSCDAPMEISEPNQAESLEVGFELSDNATRTLLDPDGVTAKWTSGDKVAVWAKGADGFAFANTAFTMRYYSQDLYTNAYFTANISEMPQGEYEYMLSYPVPTSVDGTLATYRVASQQSGKYDGKYDIMLAEPTVASALSKTSRVELNTVMRHKMHALKITVPERSSNFTDKIYRLEIIFSNDVVGDITLDVANPEAAPIYTNTSNTVVLSSEEGFDVGSDIWVFVLPGAISGEVSYKIKGLVQRSELATYPFEKELQPGRITPIRMAMPPFEKYTALHFSIGENYLGEDFDFFTLYDHNGANKGTFYRNAENRYTVEYEGEFNAEEFSNTTWKFVFDSENAIVSNDLNIGSVKPYFEQDIAPVDVPYLLFENFENVTEKESNGNNSYQASDRDQPGVSLDGSMPLNGWNAARFWLKPGAMRINSRYQSVKIIMSFASYHHGRMDTPTLQSMGLKEGKSVNVKVDFDAAMYKHTSSSLSLNSGTINIATHENQNNPIDGIPTGSTGITSSYDTTLADFGTTYFNVALPDDAGEDAFGQSFPTYTAEFPVSSASRICFYPTLSTASGTGNTEVNIYIDNLRVSISK